MEPQINQIQSKNCTKIRSESMEKTQNFKGGFFGFFKYFIQHCFIFRPSESTVWEDAGFELRTVVTLALSIQLL